MLGSHSITVPTINPTNIKSAAFLAESACSAL
jgi:hypothetical protein